MSAVAAGMAGAAGLAGIAAGGFALRPRPPHAVGTTQNLGTVRLRADVPALLSKHLDPDGDGRVPYMDTMALWGRVKLRLGPSPWLAGRMVTRHRLGRDFASEIRLTWFGKTIIHVVDAYVQNRGIAGPVTHPDVGDEIDQCANLFLWCEATMIPSTFATGSPVRAFPEDGATIRLEVPFRSTTDTAWLRFDNGHPRRFSALRYKGVGGEKVWWHVDMFDWRPAYGIWIPHRVVVTWQDEGRPWFCLDVDGFAANIGVGAHLDGTAEVIRAVADRLDEHEPG